MSREAVAVIMRRFGGLNVASNNAGTTGRADLDPRHDGGELPSGDRHQSALYLASDASSFTTGAALPVDGRGFHHQNLTRPRRPALPPYSAACGRRG